MFFSIRADRLIKIVTELKMVASLTAEDISAYTLVDVSQKSVYFLSSSGDLAVDFVINDDTIGEARTPGRFAFLYRKLQKFVFAFRIEEPDKCWYEFRAEQGTINVVFKDAAGKKRGSLTLQTINHQLIPIPSPFKETSFIINNDVIKASLVKVRYAIDPANPTESYRNLYIVLDATAGTAKFVGLNGVLLSELTLQTPVAVSGEYLVPSKYLAVLVHMVEDSGIPLHIGTYEGEIKIKFGAGCLHGAIQQGLSFQEGYERVFDQVSQSVTFSTPDALAAVNGLLGILDKDVEPTITLKLEDGDFSLSHDTSKFKVAYIGELVEPFTAYVSGNFLVKVLRAHGKAAETTIGVFQWASPIIFTSASKDLGYVHRSVLAPLNRKS